MQDRLDRVGEAGLPRFLQRVIHIVTSISRQFHQHLLTTPDSFNAVRCRLLAVKLQLANVSEGFDDPNLRDAVNSLNLAVQRLDKYTSRPNQEHGYAVLKIPSRGRRGRKRYDITKEQLEYLLSLNYSVAKMVREKVFGPGVSKRTIFLRMKDYNLKVRSFTAITDEELKLKIQTIHQSYPNSGYREVNVILKQDGIKVPRHRVQKLLKQVDPLGTGLRWASVIERRTYRVSGPNSLWHVDGNHCLIRWSLVLHGCIDGFSRAISYLILTNNNRATTALSCYLQGIAELGLPSRVRTDRGGENVLIHQFMERARGSGRGSYMVGTSVHNQRIERLWRDVFIKVLSTYYRLFYKMEDEELLDIDNPYHILCLHLVFIPRINKHLQDWRIAHNNYPLSSERSRTPMQMWLSGALTGLGSTSTATGDLLDPNLELNLIAEFEDAEIGIVPPLPVDLGIEHLAHIDILRLSDSCGLDVYNEVLPIVLTHATRLL